MKATTITGLAVMAFTASVFAAHTEINDKSAITTDGVETVGGIDWGSCPCVESGGAWNQVLGINERSTSFPFTLESVDQTQATGYARTTNNILELVDGEQQFIGELDVTVSPEAGTMYCSSYDFKVYEGETTEHFIVKDHQAVSDCRAGIYELANQENPLAPQS